MMWLSELSVGLRTKGSSVQFPVREHAWVAGQVPSRGCTRGNHTLVFLSLSFSVPSPLPKKKKVDKLGFLSVNIFCCFNAAGEKNEEASQGLKERGWNVHLMKTCLQILFNLKTE